MEQDLLSTRPWPSPISCTASKSRSPVILAAFFGQAIQSPSAGSSAPLSSLEAALEVGAGRREEHDHACARLRAELL